MGLYQYKHERGAAGGDHFISYAVTRANGQHEVIISYLTRSLRIRLQDVELLYTVCSRVATAFAKAWIVDSCRPIYVRPGASQTAAKVQRRSSNSRVVELGPRRSVRKILVRAAISKASEGGRCPPKKK